MAGHCVVIVCADVKLPEPAVPSICRCHHLLCTTKCNLAGVSNSVGDLQDKKQSISCWSQSQVRYVLGDNGYPQGNSLIVGWGKKPPQRVQNQAASCPGNSTLPCRGIPALFSGDPNPNVIQGGLVTYFDFAKTYLDDRTTNSSQASCCTQADVLWEFCDHAAAAIRVACLHAAPELFSGSSVSCVLVWVCSLHDLIIVWSLLSCANRMIMARTYTFY